MRRGDRCAPRTSQPGRARRSGHWPSPAATSRCWSASAPWWLRSAASCCCGSADALQLPRRVPRRLRGELTVMAVATQQVTDPARRPRAAAWRSRRPPLRRRNGSRRSSCVTVDVLALAVAVLLIGSSSRCSLLAYVPVALACLGIAGAYRPRMTLRALEATPWLVGRPRRPLVLVWPRRRGSVARSPASSRSRSSRWRRRGRAHLLLRGGPPPRRRGDMPRTRPSFSAPVRSAPSSRPRSGTSSSSASSRSVSSTRCPTRTFPIR